MNPRSPEGNRDIPESPSSPETMAELSPLAREIGEIALQPEISPLDAMRQWMCQSPRSSHSSIPPEYGSALERLQQIQHVSAEARPETKLTDKTIRRLISQFARYQGATDSINPHILTSDFLAAFHEQFVQDVVYFRSAHISAAEQTAFYQSSQTLMRLDAAYADHEFIAPADVRRALTGYFGEPDEYLEAFDRDIRSFSESVEPALRREFGWEGKWNFAFLKELRRAHTDMEPAARQIFQTIRALVDKYPEIPHDIVESWAKPAITRGGKPRQLVREMLSEIPKIELTDELQVAGRETLECLRTARRSGKQTYDRTTDGMAYLLEHIARENWRPSFAEFNQRAQIGILYRAAEAFNERNKANTKNHLDLSYENIYATFCAYAYDLAIFSSQMGHSRMRYTNVMHRYGPDIYERLTEEYGHLSLPSSFIKNVIARNREDLGGTLIAAAKRVKDLEKYGSWLPQRFRTAALEYGDIEARAAAFIELFPRVKAIYPWITRGDIADQLTRYKDGMQGFEPWAKKVEELQRLQPHDRIFSSTACRTLARLPEKVEDIITLHQQRVNKLMATYNHTPLISRWRAGYWAACNYAPGTINTYLKRAEHIREVLQDYGEEIDDRSLSFLAHRKNPELQVQRYLQVKAGLAQRFQDEDDIEHWMLIQAAVTSLELNFAIKKVHIIRIMRRRGVFFTQLDPSEMGGRGFRDEGAIQPEDILLQQEAQAERRVQIEALLGDLTVHERAAVEICFGLADADDEEKSALQEELGVEDLEAYVLETIIPRLQSQK